ncbi:hypothetical protein Mapa_002061 [Marchantia paleacea]|nr:hypothetical protein Mapa_002061 [Marchantia paleacea]
MLLFSFFVQATCECTFGIIIFISKRCLGIISGAAGAGVNVGTVVTQGVFFMTSKYATEQGIVFMGIMTVGCTLPVVAVCQRGGMLCPASKSTEEDYYEGEWTEKEQADGLHIATLKFAENSWSERGGKRAPKLPVDI